MAKSMPVELEGIRTLNCSAAQSDGKLDESRKQLSLSQQNSLGHYNPKVILGKGRLTRQYVAFILSRQIVSIYLLVKSMFV